MSDKSGVLGEVLFAGLDSVLNWILDWTLEWDFFSLAEVVAAVLVQADVH